MSPKPANIIYGVDDVPPLSALFFLAFQHAVLALVFIVYPLMLVTEANGTQLDAEGIVTAAILAMACGTFLQSLGRKGIGSGFLGVTIANPIYLPVSILAVHIGGLGLAFGMTMLAGIFSALFSRLLKYLRPLFPSEVCGVGVMMLGVSMVGPAVKRFIGLHDLTVVDPKAVVVAIITLALMVALSVWPKGRIRLYSAVIGLVCGYGAALWLGIIDVQSLNGVMERGVVAWPVLSIPKWSFQWALFIPFFMTALVSSLDSVAGLITCEKINQQEWVRPDIKPISGGILADGVSVFIAGVLGTLGTGVSSSHIALSAATGATSRSVGQWTALLLLAMAFVPPLAKLITHTPAPVIGAVMVYASAFLITSGMELIISRMLDTRRIFMVGCSIIVGIASIQMAELIKQLPQVLYSIAGSPFAIASLCAILLNLLFKIGTSRNASLSVELQLASVPEILSFFEKSGASWGARRQVIQRLENALNELLETMIMMNLADGMMDIQLRFNEQYLDVVVLYSGRPFSFSSTAPVPEQILEDEKQLLHLSGALIRQYADKVVVDKHKDQERIYLRFEQ